MTPEICQRLRSKRAYLGLTQEELATQLGVSRSAVKNWETGRSKCCRLHHWHLILRFLEGGLEQSTFVRKEIEHLRRCLREYTVPTLRQSFFSALKAAEQRAGGTEELLKTLEAFLHRIK